VFVNWWNVTELDMEYYELGAADLSAMKHCMSGIMQRNNWLLCNWLQYSNFPISISTHIRASKCRYVAVRYDKTLRTFKKLRKTSADETTRARARDVHFPRKYTVVYVRNAWYPSRRVNFQFGEAIGSIESGFNSRSISENAQEGSIITTEAIWIGNKANGAAGE